MATLEQDITAVLREEMEDIVSEIKARYNASDRKVSGQFAKGLSVVYEGYSATVRGYYYLAGRGATKKKGKAGEPTLAQAIEQWMEDKGIANRIRSEHVTDKAKANAVRGVAYVIARKIHRQGTDKSKWWKIYEEVITPQRIDKIIDRVAELNVNRIITTITAELEILAKNV